MSESRPAQRNSSRAVAIVAVVSLVLIAVAGIVFATLSRRAATPPVAQQQALSASTARQMPGMTASAAQAAAVAAERPDHVSFTPGSDTVPDDAAPLIAKFVEAARSGNSKLRLTTTFTASESRAKELDLAKARTRAVRRMVEASGKAVAMQYETVEMPAGTLSERDANRVVLSLH